MRPKTSEKLIGYGLGWPHSLFFFLEALFGAVASEAEHGSSAGPLAVLIRRIQEGKSVDAWF